MDYRLSFWAPARGFIILPMKQQARTKLFSAALDDLMQEKGVTQVELARRTGIAVSRINNYVKGRYRTVRTSHVERIAGAFGGPGPGGLLVEAYLHDLVPERLRGLFEVRYPDMPKATKWSLPSKRLPQPFADGFRELYFLCAANVTVRERTQEWIQLMRETRR